MSSGVTCTLYAAGERIADGAPDDDPDDPTALSGLRLTWGRSDTVDQPEPSTLSFDLADTPGGLAVKDILATGTEIDVTATGLIYAPAAVSTFRDPGFEAGPASLTGLTHASSHHSARAHGGAYGTELRAAGGGGLAAIFAPAAFVPAGSNPAAWDDLAKTAAGQVWRLGVWLWAPPGVQVTLGQVLFSAPYESSATYHGPLRSTVGVGAWALLEVDFTPADHDCWVGFQVSAAAMPSWDLAAGSWDQAAGPWDDRGSVWVDDVALLAPAAGVPRTVLVWSGRVTNLVSSWPDSSPWPLVTVTAADFTADLANRDVGDVPWAVESMAARVARIIALAAPGLPVTIPPNLGPIPVSWRDVDSQPATGLLAELGTSVDAVMWAATHQVSGPYLEFEDPGTRPPDRVLALVGGVVVIESSTAGALEISACDLPRDAVRWTQDVSDVISRTAVSWLIQGVDDDGLPTTTESTFTLIDPSREANGTRRYGVSTQLTTQADASTVAARIMARTALGWRASGIQIDDAARLELPADSLLTLLDGTARNGLAIALDEVPAWAPAGPTVGLYVEGGQYEFSEGWWLLELTVSSASGAGQSATWDALPAAWHWNTFDESVTWDELSGVGLLT